MVVVSWFAPVSTTRVWPSRKPNRVASAKRRPIAPAAVAPFSVVRSALFAYWSITVDRSANDVVTTKVFVYFAALPAVSCSATDWVCLPTVSVFSGSAFGMTSSRPRSSGGSRRRRHRS